MWFDNRRISEIKPQEIIDLFDSAREDQWLDFKQDAYQLNVKQLQQQELEEQKFEMLKDISSMANAEGGYIILGISEKHRVAIGFVNIDDPEKVSKRIKDICSQSLEPRIQNLEAEPYQVSWKSRQYNIVIIHIPPSSIRPHCIKWKNTSVFVKRHQDSKRDMAVSELGEAFSVRYYPQILDRIDSKLAMLAGTIQEAKRGTMSPQEDALQKTDVKDLLHLMQLRFQTDYADLPYYRIISVPQDPKPNLIPTEDQSLLDVLRNPTARSGGFGFRGVYRILPTPEGFLGMGEVGQQEVVLLKNGFLELRCPLDNGHFQWWKEEAGFPPDSKWLYPYAVCEYPVSFMRLAKSLYSEAGIKSDTFLVQQEYWHLTGFTLIEGHPGNPFFGSVLGKHEYTPRPHTQAAVTKCTIKAEFAPDPVAYELVKGIYNYFEFGESSIPAFFNVDHNFTLRQGTIC